MRQLSTRVLNILRTLDLSSTASVPPVSVIVVGVSGGADSLALLHLLKSHQTALNVSLHVATLDHGLRGEAGAQDAAHVAQLAREWGLTVSVGHAMLDPATDGEAQAREARYQFFAEVASEVGAQIVAVAHHADDQAETVLINLIRGASISGLSGMAYSSPLPYASHIRAPHNHTPPLRLIRPLLDITRAEIEAYCAEHGLEPRTDATNVDTRYRRNRIRHEVLPLLAEMNPQIQTALRRLANSATLQDDFLHQSLSERLEGHLQRDLYRWTVPRAVYSALHPALRHRLLWAAVSALGVMDSGTVHILHADEIAMRADVGKIAEFTGGVRLRVDYESIHIEHQDAPREVPEDLLLMPEDAEIRINIHGETHCTGSWGIRVYDTPPDEGYDAALCIPEGAEVILRTRRAGDRFQPLGMSGNLQKINKWMINHKISVNWRANIPLLTINDRVVAVILKKKWFLSKSQCVDKDVKYLQKFIKSISL